MLHYYDNIPTNNLPWLLGEENRKMRCLNNNDNDYTCSKYISIYYSYRVYKMNCIIYM